MQHGRLARVPSSGARVPRVGDTFTRADGCEFSLAKVAYMTTATAWRIEYYDTAAQKTRGCQVTYDPFGLVEWERPTRAA
jgi:hypothetical protein